MTYTPPREQLRGLPLEIAECYGKPNINAHYAADIVKSNRLDDGALCACCGRMATNSHHCPPLSKGRTFVLRTDWGIHILKPALIAVCGSGTTGCHDGFHGGARFKARWHWDSDEIAEAWWSGELLKGMYPHSKRLYGLGCWLIEDRRTGDVIEIRQ